jgi:thiamine-monophosphate kinase
LGGSAATLQRLCEGKRIPPRRSNRHFYPLPRLEAGLWLRRQRLATAMIDLSDGLSVDLAHLCQESHVAARINAGDIPVAKGANLELALHGGDDYELLFTAPAKVKVPARIVGVKVTAIGTVVSHTGHAGQKDYRSAIEIVGQNNKTRILAAHGWQHFAKKG